MQFLSSSKRKQTFISFTSVLCAVVIQWLTKHALFVVFASIMCHCFLCLLHPDIVLVVGDVIMATGPAGREMFCYAIMGWKKISVVRISILKIVWRVNYILTFAGYKVRAAADSRRTRGDRISCFYRHLCSAYGGSELLQIAGESVFVVRF